MAEPILTMIPGPTPVREEILRALAEPTTSHQAPEFVAAYRRCLADVARIVMTSRAQPFVVAGSGSLAMEMAVVNLLPPGSRLLVVSQGYFGDRWAEVAAAFGVECEVLRSEWGHAVPSRTVAAALDGATWSAVAMTHVDTSTGTAAPVAEYCELLRGRDELALLDGVCATAGIEERFDDWGLDVLVTGAQKAFGAPPGVAVLVASDRALARRRELDRVPAYTADLLRWLPIMHEPGGYFSTPPVNEIRAMERAARVILDEGLEVRFERHARLARGFRAGLAALGLEPFTQPSCRADTLTVVRHAEGVDDAAFREALAGRGVIVAGGLGPVKGRVFRVGHMGNIGAPEIHRALSAIESVLADGGHAVERGAAVAASGLEG